jgi:exonuclease III
LLRGTKGISLVPKKELRYLVVGTLVLLILYKMAAGDIIGGGYSLSCINCNSLNMSDSTKVNQQKKLFSITKLKTDIILMSDIRLSNRSKVSVSNELTKIFRTNPFGNYEFFFNSTKNKRGVGILISTKLNYSIITRRDDTAENYLLLLLDIQGKRTVVGAIYGPNNTDPDFFANLKTDLNNLGCQRIVLGGDWNCSVSTDDIRYNIDCLNMRALPNLRHSVILNEMCTDLNLVDPFRLKYPNKRDYTFVPRAVGNNNRSRLDFF